MKKILILIAALIIAAYGAFAHCYTHPCSSFTTVSGSVSFSYTTSKCFRSAGSGTTVFNSSCTFTGWDYLYFSTKTDCKATITFPIGGEVYYYGDNKASHLILSNNCIIKNDGDLTINTLNITGINNFIYTDYRIKINGVYYYPRDTIKDGACWAVITDCYGTSLPLTLLKYSGRSINNEVELMWETVENEPVSVLYSENGQDWKTLSNNATSPYSFKSNSTFNCVRIMSKDSVYSSTLVFKLDKITSTDVYDLQGNRLTIEPINEIYIKEGKKYLILKQ